MSDAADVTGVVLAGGRSRRFGEADKALAKLDGTALVGHVVRALAGVVSRVVVNCRPDQREPFGAAIAEAGVDATVEFALDEEPDEGPLAGLRTALAAVETPYAAVLACDMPLVTAETLATLCARARDTGETVVPRTDGGFEPTCAVYHVPTARRAADERYGAGERSLHALLSALDPTVVDAEALDIGDRELTSVDTRETLAALRDA